MTWQQRPFPGANLLLLPGGNPTLVDSGFAGHAGQTADWAHAHTDQLSLLACDRSSFPVDDQGCLTIAEVCYLFYTSSMALSIKSDEADRLARELAAETGETLTDAVETALRERLDREHAKHVASMRTRLARLAADVAALPVADDRTAEEIIGYDDAGLPR